MNFKSSKKIKGLAVLGLVSMLGFVSVAPSYAQINGNFKDTNNKILTTQITNDSYLIESNEETSILTVIEDNSKIKKIKIEDTTNGKIDYLTYDKSSNKVYSTITGKETSVEELSSYEDSSYEDRSYEDRSSRTEVKYSQYKISYKKIHDIVGRTVTAAKLVGVILMFTPAFETGYAIKRVAGYIGEINDLLKNASPNHGIVIHLKTQPHYRIRAGHRNVYKVTTDFSSLSLY